MKICPVESGGGQARARGADRIRMSERRDRAAAMCVKACREGNGDGCEV